MVQGQSGYRIAIGRAAGGASWDDAAGWNPRPTRQQFAVIMSAADYLPTCPVAWFMPGYPKNELGLRISGPGGSEYNFC